MATKGAEDVDGPLDLCPLNHISIPSRDINVSRDFYRDVLGCTELKCPEFGFGVKWVLFPGGSPGGNGTALHIVEAEGQLPKPEAEKGIRRSYHFCFRVDNIDAQVEKLKRKGIDFTVEMVPGGSTVRQVLFFDPDGNGIELQNCNPLMPVAA
mmetsp:Transcript_30399/g.72327  ORF Transcript_30399/g.72327 Transcript_30399/m.72327 type:complete len:153 (-) Transcript_30399:72-530(-)